MHDEGVPDEQLVPVSGGERVRLNDDVVVSVYPSLHSCAWSQKAMEQSDVVCLGDAGLTWQEQQARFAELRAFGMRISPEVASHVTALRQDARGDGGALVYVFETPYGSLLYQDTSGHWSKLLHGLRPDVAIMAAAGRGNIDGDPIQGSLADFVARQAELLQPRRVIPSHHDDWMPGFSVPTDLEPIRAAMARTSPDSTLVELDYVPGHRPFD